MELPLRSEVTIHLVADASARTLPRRGDTERVGVVDPPLVRPHEIRSARVRGRKGPWSLIAPRSAEYWLELTLDEGAAARVEAATRGRVGTRLAVVVQGHVVHEVPLVEPFSGAVLRLYGYRAKEDAEAALDELRGPG